MILDDAPRIIKRIESFEGTLFRVFLRPNPSGIGYKIALSTAPFARKFPDFAHVGDYRASKPFWSAAQLEQDVLATYRSMAE